MHIRLQLTLLIALMASGLTLLVGCGTLEVGMNEDVAQSTAVVATASTQTAAPTATVAPSPLPSPTLPSEPAVEVLTPEVNPSALWATYRDPDTGFGYAFPCHWVTQGRTLVSYDEAYFMDHSIKGQWDEGNPPAGAIKLEIAAFDYPSYGIEPGAPLEDAAKRILSDEIVSSEMVTLAGRDALRVELSGTVYPNDTTNEIYFFPMSPESILLVSVTPRSALDSPDVQGIIDSLAMAQDEPITLPVVDPQVALEGRQVLADVAGGYCLQYPDNYSLEAYPPSGIPYVGDISTLKLERPFYTVGLTVTALPVGEQSDLEELVSQFIQGLPDGSGDQVNRNPAERIGGVEFQIGGEPAEFLEGVPGATGSREIFVKHENRLYRLSFVPSIRVNPQAESDLETFFLVVTTSFSFLPPGE